MKSRFNQEQHTGILSRIVVVAFAISFAALILYFKQVWGFVETLFSLASPFLLGFAIAYLLGPPLHFFERGLKKLVFKNNRFPKVARALASVLALLALLAVIALFLTFLLPELISSIESVINNISSLLKDNSSIINQFLLKYDFLRITDDEIGVAWDNIAGILLSRLNDITSLLDNIFVISKTIVSSVFQVLVGIITAFYILLDKENIAAQIKKIGYSIMKNDHFEEWIYWTRRANKIFTGFICGKLVDSLIIGIICYVGMLIFRMEYPLLISCVIGVTNIIPFFGPFIGWAPCALLLLIVNPISALWFSLFILFLQQLDGNVIGPHILGDYVGVSALSIMIAIVIGGGLFGFVGMLVSVPLYALGYAFFRTLVYASLKKKNMPTGTEEYINAPDCFHPQPEDKAEDKIEA